MCKLFYNHIIIEFMELKMFWEVGCKKANCCIYFYTEYTTCFDLRNTMYLVSK